MRGAGLIGRRLQTDGLVAFAPRGDGLPRDAVPFADLINDVRSSTSAIARRRISTATRAAESDSGTFGLTTTRP